MWRCLPDSAGYIQFYGEERFADAFILTNNGKGTLKVQVSTEDVNDPALPTLYVYSSFLTEVKSNSALSVSAESVPPAADFKVTLIGNGRIDAGGLRCTRVSAKIATGNGVVTLGGECHDASFAMLGTGQIRADELEAQDVSCSIMGTGSIYTWPVEKLSTKGIGSTTIYYRGTPGEIRKRGRRRISGRTLPPWRRHTPSRHRGSRRGGDSRRGSDRGGCRGRGGACHPARPPQLTCRQRHVPRHCVICLQRHG